MHGFCGRMDHSLEYCIRWMSIFTYIYIYIYIYSYMYIDVYINIYIYIYKYDIGCPVGETIYTKQLGHNPHMNQGGRLKLTPWKCGVVGFRLSSFFGLSG